MTKIESIDDELRGKIIEFLYKDELQNVQMIHGIENRVHSNLGDVYIEWIDHEIASLLQVKFDGNSHFTNFYTTRLEGLEAIAMKIKENRLKNQLVAGKKADIAYILSQLGQDREVETSYYYRLEGKPLELLSSRNTLELRRMNQGEEKEVIKRFLVDYFEADTEEAILELTSDEKLQDKLENGFYILYDQENPIGMARFLGWSNLYACITTVYIDPKHRSKGYGKQLLTAMIKEANRLNKIPVLQVSADHKAAIQVYEAVGFVVEYEYAFEFI